LRATIGRHKPSNGLPYTRIMAAFMLATLISALFALPAYADAPTITNVGSAPAVLPGGAYSYTVVVTNNAIADTGVVVTDTLTNATTSSQPSFVTSTNPVPVLCTGAVSPYTCTDPNIAASETMTITVPVTAGALGTATNLASVATAHTPGPATATATTTVASADLTIAKNHTAGTLTPGSDVTYNLVVSNPGPSTATTVVAHDTLDTSLTFKSSASCTALLQVVTCTVPDVVAATPQTVSFVATISPTASLTTAINNTATVTTATPDPTAGVTTSNVDTFTPTANPVDLGVVVTVDPTTAAPGDTVTYTVAVTNLSTTTDATSVVVTDALPAGLIADSPPLTPTLGTAAVASNTWTWTIPTLAHAVAPATPAAVTATFTATVDPATVLTTITNTATVTGAQADLVSTNNTSSVDLTISASSADLNVVTAVDDSKPNQGDIIQITIQVSNSGPADATNIVVKDVLPTGLKYVSCQPAGCDQSGLRRQTSQQFSIPSVLADSADSVDLFVVVQASQGTLQNTASIVSFDQTDPTPANNNDSLSITIGGSANNPGGPTGSTGGTGGTTGGTTAFTGFTAGQLMPWFMLLFSLGLVAVEWSRRMRLVSPIGSTYGFDPFQS
jgi:uncharacterized repeat protein (TIGR01451 family)